MPRFDLEEVAAAALGDAAETLAAAMRADAPDVAVGPVDAHSAVVGSPDAALRARAVGAPGVPPAPLFVAAAEAGPEVARRVGAVLAEALRTRMERR